MNNFLQNLGDKKILVIGDCILDHYVFSEVKRISPEAPVPIAKVKSEIWKLGGASNTAQNIRALGAQVNLLGVIGDDFDAKQFIGLLEKEGIDDHLVSGDLKTIKKTRIVSHNQQMIRLDYEDAFEVNDEIRKDVLEKYLQLVASADLVVISDYGKGSLDPILIEKIIGSCRDNNIKTIVDPKPIHCRAYKGASFLTPNMTEAMMMSGIDGENRYMEIGGKLSFELQSTVVLTRGAQGMDVFEDGEHLLHVPSFAKAEVYDVTGAGDTVVAVLAACAATDISLKESCMLASAGAALAIKKLGTAQIKADELMEFASFYMKHAADV